MNKLVLLNLITFVLINCEEYETTPQLQNNQYLPLFYQLKPKDLLLIHLFQDPSESYFWTIQSQSPQLLVDIIDRQYEQTSEKDLRPIDCLINCLQDCQGDMQAVLINLNPQLFEIFKSLSPEEYSKVYNSYPRKLYIQISYT